MNQLRILIADDHAAVRSGIRSLLLAHSQCTVCGEATNGLEAVEQAKSLRPDLVLMDVSMPEMDGVEAARIVRNECPDVQVILISQNDTAAMEKEAARVGAKGFISKSRIAQELFELLRSMGDREKTDGAAAPQAERRATRSASWNCLVGGGEMGELMRSLDWSRTAVGPVSQWPQSLRIAVSIMLGSGYGIAIAWGPEFTFFYNNGYRPILGRTKHPALGKATREIFPEAWHFIGPLFNRVLNEGEDTTLVNQIFFLDRKEYLEECYFTFSYSPIPDDGGKVGGVLVTVVETTEQFIEDRRLHTFRDLAGEINKYKSEVEICDAAAGVFARSREDLPFTLIYLNSPKENVATLAAVSGIAVDTPISPKKLALDDTIWPLARVMSTRTAQTVELQNWNDHLPESPWGDLPRSAISLPIFMPGIADPAGFLIAGVNPRKELDSAYRTFLDRVVVALATEIAGARALEAERRRAEALAELDQAKTAFFSNVSHEFRTPLTLMLGPLEDLLGKARDLPGNEQEQLALVHRNGLRLLKLVNTLLDFSRIEAGRVQAFYEPTDLAAFTSDLASVFRSAVERAGLRLIVDCQDVPEPVYVDRDMWEKIVLNLLSNAFKFTLQGEIAVELKTAGQNVELSVRDTGCGIAAEELPHIFERFHRIQTASARTNEGTGIGLALIQELVKLHGGAVRVDSTPGAGTTFTVSIPSGTAHLPAHQLRPARTQNSTVLGAQPYIEEAIRWLPDSDLDTPPAIAAQGLDSATQRTFETGTSSEAPSQRILVADDNADMRDYLRRLLRERYLVETVADGDAALQFAREWRPDLIVSDVMMPHLDGFGLLHALRNDQSLKSIPFILLSARAGEESRLEGLAAGADDYLVKPFSARELLARVASQLAMSRLRREAAETERKLRAEAELERNRIREVFKQVPAGIALLTGPKHRFAFVNSEYVSVTGRKAAEDFLGKPLLQALPEIERQGFVELLDQVYRTGVPYVANERLVVLNRGADTSPEDSYFNFIYQPIKGLNGAVQEILVHCIDVTPQVLARQELEKRERASSLLAAIVDSSDDAIVSKDLNGMITSWNRGAERIFGYNASEAVGQHITLIIPPDRRKEEDDILRRLRRGERIDHFETVRQRKDGKFVDVSLTISPVRDSKGRVIGASKVARDITAQKRTEIRERQITAEIAAAKAKFQAVFEQTTQFAGIMSKDGVLVEVNKLFLESCGYRAEDVIGLPFWETAWWRNFPESRDKVRTATTAAAEGTVYNEILRYSWADGSEHLVNFALYPIRDEEGEILFLHPTGVDITELKNAEEKYRKLAESLDAEVRKRTRQLEERSADVVRQSEQLRELSWRLLRTQDEERRHIARELHDSAGQTLTVLGINLAQLIQKTGRHAPDLAREAESIQEIVRQLHREIRTTSYLLHPPLLDESGLSSALHWYVEGLVERSGLEIGLDISADFGRLPREMELMIFRLVQECVTNIHRHSGSKTATISLTRDAAGVRVEVRDQGKGMSPERLAEIQSRGSGVGIRGMRERVRQFGGDIKIDSGASGTTVSVTIPVPSAAEDQGRPERIEAVA